MATVMEPAGRFEIGRVFGRSFGVITRNLPLYIGLSLLLAGLPALIVGLLAPVPRTPEALMAAGGFPKAALVGGFVSYVFGLVLQATLVRATIEDLSDRRPNFSDCLATGFQLLLPVFGIAIVSGIGIMIGMVLLIVPGIILALMWSVAVPAEVEQRNGVMASLSRSRALTSGNRWKILGLLFLSGIAIGIVQAVIVGVTTPMGMSVVTVVSAILSALASAVLATIIATSYVELRMVKEGADVTSLAAVFN